MIEKVKCVKNRPGFTKNRVYVLVEPTDEDSCYVELYNDSAQEVKIELPSSNFEVIE